MKINVVTLCSGYGAQEMALDRLKRDYPDFDWELLAWAEIEPNAIKAHQACHPEYADRNLGDITVCDYSKITQTVDLLIYSTPCQSVSVAGQNKGMKEGSGAASALIWHTRRAIETLKPKVCILENVRGMIMGKNVKEFNKWQHVMESYGYTNFAKVLDSSQYGVPQHRERLFMVSILDCTQSYHFPEPFKLEKRIKDILEPYGTVDESFYFKPEQLLRIIAHCDRKVEEGCGFKTQFHTDDEISGCDTTRYGQRETDPCIKEGISIHPLNRKMEFQGFKSIQSNTEPCLTAHDGRGGEPVLWQRLSLYDNNAQAGRVYDVDGIAPCLDTCCGGNRMPKIMESVDRQSKIRSKVMPNGNIRFYQDDESKSGISEMQIIHEDNICPTITTAHIPKILTSVRSEEMKELRRKGIEKFSGRVNVPREDGICNTITTVTKDYLLQEPCILGYTRDKKGNVVDYHDKDVANTVHTMTGGGWNTDQFVKEPMVGNDPRRIFGQDDFRSDVCGALMAVDYKAPKLVKEPIELSFDNLPDKTVLKDEDGKGYLWQDGSLWRVRKLHPIETSRLMDVADEDFYKMQDAGISKSALYCLFGNSIVVNVLYHIFRKLWIDTENESAQKSLFDF